MMVFYKENSAFQRSFLSEAGVQFANFSKTLIHARTGIFTFSQKLLTELKEIGENFREI
jgi:hypothetical protein